MPSIMDRLFPGRKPRTPDAILATLDAARDALATAQARAASATDRRKTAIASGDRLGAIAAEAERAGAEIDGEIASGEIAELEAGLAEAVRHAEAEARAAALAVLVERRRVLGQRLESEYRAAAATMASVLSAFAELQRDVAEGGFEREVERSPEVSRGLMLQTEAVANVSSFLKDSLASPPTVPESPKEAAYREHQARRERERVERKAESDRKHEEGRERLRASREAEDAKARERERNPFYPTLQHSDIAR